LGISRVSTGAVLTALAVTLIAMVLTGLSGPGVQALPGMPSDGPAQKLNPTGSVNMLKVAQSPRTGDPQVKHLEIDKRAAGPKPQNKLAPRLALGGANAPSSAVVSGGDTGAFDGIDNIDMQGGGTGTYANSNPGLEPPDQGLCVGAGYVMETVNDSLRVYNTSGQKLTTLSVPLAQFFALPKNASANTEFISDPRCYFDHATQRWFVVILGVSEIVSPNFIEDDNFVAVSKSSNPLADWNLYHFNVTDNGLNGSPAHAECLVPGAPEAVPGCLGDQPTIGADDNGIYITDNEYSYAEVLAAGPPGGPPPFQQVPVLRSGVAQLYALSKSQLVGGSSTTLVRFDSATVPFPGVTEDSPWQSISPAQPSFGDTTPEPPGGVEYFLSDIGLPVGHDSTQIVAWAWTNTSSLNTASPNLALQHVLFNTTAADHTFFMPDPSPPSSTPFFAYQKVGPAPLAVDTGQDPEEVLNANDDRMNWVVLSHGSLFSGVNTQLPPANLAGTGHEPDPRVGIMWFQATPSFNGPNLQATMTHDGYINVPRNNVLFPSFGARPDGATVATFTLAGLDYFPSLAWARVDGLGVGQGPDVHVARLGKAPEDGFSGVGLTVQAGLPDIPGCSTCVARWGDYTSSQLDENGCIWGAAEYINSTNHDQFGVINWGTGVHTVCLPPVPVAAQPITPEIVAMPNTAAAGAPPLVILGLLAAIAVLLRRPLLLLLSRRG
jgi:hypothetical protein